ncbi:hypothetical protein MXB_4979 [Myxobolus squamalis]|nr:hypothetical protein MXB_4979 [Myxobolus squamalis]
MHLSPKKFNCILNIKIIIFHALSHVGQRVSVCGWVSSIRRQGKNLIFIILRDSSGYLQCVCYDDLFQNNKKLTTSSETTICVHGIIRNLPEGKVAPGQIELSCDNLQVITRCSLGGIKAVLTASRVEEFPDIIKIRSSIINSFRDYYTEHDYFEVTSPTLVQTQREGGSALFRLDFFGDKAYLTQSSQLHLEAVIPNLRNIFCIAQSYSAEQFKTRRNYAELTHIEAEIPCISFDELLQAVEDLACGVLDRMLASNVELLLKKFNPNISGFKRPFKRMLYTDALQYLNNHNITKDDGSFYEFGENIPEATERKMMNEINEPIFLIKFPASIKSLYMKKDQTNIHLTESVDLLLPGVGVIIGGSMRVSHSSEYFDVDKKENIDSTVHYLNTDQHKYRFCEHGGYGLFLERYLSWLTNRNNIRDFSCYPRFISRARA